MSADNNENVSSETSVDRVKQLIEQKLATLSTTDFINCDVEDLFKDLKTTWVRTLDELESLMDILEVCDEVALDTEFIKRNTFYPELALIQVNTGDEIYLVDAPNLDLSTFWQVLSEIPIIIWHACGEDLNIFYLLSDLPPLTNIFDTQIGMAFLTTNFQLGYQKSVDDMLGVRVDKEQSQSNWLARPLSLEQEVYASNDVKYLLPLYHAIVKQLIEKNLFEQVWEDCQMYSSDIYKNYQTKDEEQYLSALSYRHNGLQREFLRELLTWRECLARSTNQPRTFIIKKQAITELVDFMPTTIKSLKYDTTLHRSIIENYGREIIKIVKKVKQVDALEYPPSIIKPYHSKDKAVQKAITTVVTSYSEKTGISKKMVIKKKWLAKVYEVVALDEDLDKLPKALKGWRREWVNNELIPVLMKYKQDLRYGMNIDINPDAEIIDAID